jgi:hypothetical protein
VSLKGDHPPPFSDDELGKSSNFISGKYGKQDEEA